SIARSAARRRPCRLGCEEDARRRARSTTRAAPAVPPTTSAAAGRAQFRGSRIAESSHASSSSAAISVMLVRAPSRRLTRSAGGSTGASASRSRPSKAVAASLIGGPLAGAGARTAVAHDLLELLDGAMDQDLGGAVGAAQRTSDLPVVHAEGEAHDQRLAA